MSIASLADDNAAFQTLEQQGIETLERVHDVHVDVNHWLEQSIVDASLAKCLPWLYGSTFPKPRVACPGVPVGATDTLCLEYQAHHHEGTTSNGSEGIYQASRGLRVLNTPQSCDTLALSMDIFEPRQSQRRVVDAFAHLMEVISC
ncbi:hypothetical protein PsorP6_016945 [Peronosclerospora sorghi]|uniref:Uncharacterized protein n=1 Tax=Peronosclerospora sorghi TaxID=230839 RepID=A0ACC0WEY5_9STRA|nr:hypothetical protein PsorP6_016945 [Peronosclerospora sorghi]